MIISGAIIIDNILFIDFFNKIIYMLACWTNQDNQCPTLRDILLIIAYYKFFNIDRVPKKYFITNNEVPINLWKM